jgi:hypothetical protein
VTISCGNNDYNYKNHNYFIFFFIGYVYDHVCLLFINYYRLIFALVTLLREFQPCGIISIWLLCLNYYNRCHGNTVKRFLVLWFALLTIKLLTTSYVRLTAVMSCGPVMSSFLDN